jgi:hypothetical protein
MASMGDIATWSVLGLGIILIIIALGFIGATSPDKDANTIRKNLGVVAGVSGGGVLAFGIAAYLYFSTHVNYLTPFLLIMTFVNLALCVMAVSIASLKITNA